MAELSARVVLSVDGVELGAFNTTGESMEHALVSAFDAAMGDALRYDGKVEARRIVGLWGWCDDSHLDPDPDPRYVREYATDADAVAAVNNRPGRARAAPGRRERPLGRNHHPLTAFVPLRETIAV